MYLAFAGIHVGKTTSVQPYCLLVKVGCGHLSSDKGENLGSIGWIVDPIFKHLCLQAGQ